MEEAFFKKYLTFKYQLHSPAFNYPQDLEFHPAKVAHLLLNIDKYFGAFLTFICVIVLRHKQENTKDAGEAATVSVAVLLW